MCLGVPVRIIQVKGNTGFAEFKVVKREISLELVDKVKKGDYVIMHAGFAIQKMERKEARATLKLLEKAGQSNGEG